MSTPNLALSHIAAAQNQKEVTANAAFDGLDEALCNFSSFAMADVDLALTDPQALGNMILAFTGTLTAGRNIILPQSNKIYIVNNSTTGGFSLTFKTGAAGTPGTVAVAAGAVKLIYCDSTNVVVVG
jgi:hypothetical protein